MSDDISKVVAVLRSDPALLDVIAEALLVDSLRGDDLQIIAQDPMAMAYRNFWLPDTREKAPAVARAIADYLGQHARTAPEATGADWLAWARGMFGDIAADPKERALRFVEEALELGQAIGIDAATVAKTADRVYSRPAGSPAKEIAQSSATLDTLAHVMGVDPRAASTAEFTRVKTIPKEEWTRRHQAKVDAGFALTEPAPEA